jgi:hypothetical protein
MNDARWFVSRDDQVNGPFTERDIQQQWLDGQLRIDDLVWQSGTTKWVKAGDVAGLVPPELPKMRSSYAGFWKRLVAWLIDSLVMLLIQLVLFAISYLIEYITDSTEHHVPL